MIPVVRQCELLSLPRSSFYYSPCGEDGHNLTLMRLMGLAAVYPKPRLSANGPDHKVYGYLLKGVMVQAPDEA